MALLPLLPLTSHFLLQQKDECSFLNGMQRVRFLQRYFYNWQEYVHFDSDLRKHMAVTALGEADNSRKLEEERKKVKVFFVDFNNYKI
uniref:MHC class II beta chain N-terminal domain-containing protein n=1 Tax=Laticauda laticaudata TaxID=8630 RepID=A0A8C5RHX4_LATLA